MDLFIDKKRINSITELLIIELILDDKILFLSSSEILLDKTSDLIEVFFLKNILNFIRSLIICSLLFCFSAKFKKAFDILLMLIIGF